MGIVTKYKVHKMRKIASALIKFYFKNEYANKPDIEKELERVDEILNNIPIMILKKTDGQVYRGCYDGKKVTLFVKNESVIRDDEFWKKEVDLVHEFIHAITESQNWENNTYIEEGYVTLIGTEVIRYAIDNIDNIDGLEGAISKKNLQILDESGRLKNGYINESEFIRSARLIMKQNGFDSDWEYMFSENNFEQLCLIAKSISPEFGRIMSNKSIKLQNFSKNLASEKEFFNNCFAKMDFSSLSKTDVEMNSVLVEYLIESGVAKQDKRIYDIINQVAPDRIKYYEMMSDLKSVEPKNLKERIYQYIPNYSWVDIKEKLTIFSNGFDLNNLRTIFILYEGLDNENKQLDENYIEKMFFSINARLLKNKIKYYEDSVYGGIQEGKSDKEIIDKFLVNSIAFSVKTEKLMENGSKENYWDRLEEFADLVNEESNENHEDFYNSFYEDIIKLTKRYFDTETTIYTNEDFVQFREKIQGIYTRAQMPQYMAELGFTPEKIFIRSISERAEREFKNFPLQMWSLLNIVDENALELGDKTGDMDDFSAQLKNAYEIIEESGDKKSLKEFQALCLKLFFSTDKLKTTNYKIGAVETKNPYISNMIDKIVTSPALYENLSSLDNVAIDYPDLFNSGFLCRAEFLELLKSKLTSEQQKKLSGDISIDNIEGAVIGKNATIKDVWSFDYSETGPEIEFALKQNKVFAINGLMKGTRKLALALDYINELADTGNPEAMKQAKRVLGNFRTKLSQRKNRDNLKEKTSKFVIMGLKEKSSKLVMGILKQETLFDKEDRLTFTNREDFENLITELKESGEYKNMDFEELLKISTSASCVATYLNSDTVEPFKLKNEEPIITKGSVIKMAQDPNIRKHIPYAERTIRATLTNEHISMSK